MSIYIQYLLDKAVPFIRAENSKKAVSHTSRRRVKELEEKSLSYFNDERMDPFMVWSSEYRAYGAYYLKERRKTAEILARVREKSLL